MQVPMRAVRNTTPPAIPPTMAPVCEDLLEVAGSGGAAEDAMEVYKQDELGPEETRNEADMLAMSAPTASIAYTPDVTLTGSQKYDPAVARSEEEMSGKWSSGVAELLNTKRESS